MKVTVADLTENVRECAKINSWSLLIVEVLSRKMRSVCEREVDYNLRLDVSTMTVVFLRPNECRADSQTHCA